MRRHSKASSAGSNTRERQAVGLGRIFRRAFATRAFAHVVEGTGAPSTRHGSLAVAPFSAVAASLLSAAALLAASAAPAAASTCPNEPFRIGPSAQLPDCRAYERVTPADMEGQQAAGDLEAPTASPDGEAVAYITFGAFGDKAESNTIAQQLARRGSEWGTESLSPPVASYAPFVTKILLPFGFTEDLDKWMTEGPWNPPLTPDANPNTFNLYLRDNSSGDFRLLSPGMAEEPFPGTLEKWGSVAVAVSAHAEHVVFSSDYPLTGCESSSAHLCDWNEATGTLSLIGHLPDNSVSPNEVALGMANYRHPVSADGSVVFFHESGGGECGACVRINDTVTHLASETGRWEIASPDGSVAYLIDGGDLERYDVARDEVSSPIAGEVQGVLGASVDGSEVYFASKEALAAGATGGEDNVYLWKQGTGLKYVATANADFVFESNWKLGQARQISLNSRVTPDGMHLAFISDTNLTGYDSNGAPEAYLYNAATGRLDCASCNPLAEPRSPASVEFIGESGAQIEGGNDRAGILQLPRNLSDDGRYLFFMTEEALVPRDTNSARDVYEYDTESGEIHLLSSGTDVCRYCGASSAENGGTWFGDASASGNDVFFVTLEQFVPADRNKEADVYDVRVNGGVASQYPPPASPCSGDSCRDESGSVPETASPASAALVGPGNLKPLRNCARLARRAGKLRSRARLLERHAKLVSGRNHRRASSRMRQRSSRLRIRAKRATKALSLCRRGNRRAGR